MSQPNARSVGDQATEREMGPEPPAGSSGHTPPAHPYIAEDVGMSVPMDKREPDRRFLA